MDTLVRRTVPGLLMVLPAQDRLLSLPAECQLPRRSGPASAFLWEFLTVLEQTLPLPAVESWAGCFPSVRTKLEPSHL